MNQTGAVRQTITVKPRVRGQPQSSQGKGAGKKPTHAEEWEKKKQGIKEGGGGFQSQVFLAFEEGIPPFKEENN